MKLSQLLASRSALVRQAALANAALAYSTLAGLDRRIRRARLSGPVRLLAPEPALGRYAPQLLALAGSQAVLDEHFDEADLVRLADALAYAADSSATEFDFRLEDMFAVHAPPLHATLREAGVVLDEPATLPWPRS